MIRLFSDQRSGTCYKIPLLLSQLSIPFEVREVDLVRGEQRTPEFRVKSPASRVPAVRTWLVRVASVPGNISIDHVRRHALN